MDILLAGDLLDADHAFMAGLVRQPGRTGQVADGIDAGLGSAAVLVGHHMGLLDLHLGGLKSDVFHIADDADREDHALDGDLALLAGLVLQHGGDGCRCPS